MKKKESSVLGLAIACGLLIGCSSDPLDGEPISRAGLREVAGHDGECIRIMWHEAWRYLDAYTSVNGRVVTRTVQDNDTQLWCFTEVETLGWNRVVYTIQHRTFSGQFLDAFETNHDYRVLLLNAQNNDSQRWLVTQDPSNPWVERIQQYSTLRYLDAYPDSDHDYRAVTRPYQNNDSQRWVVDSGGWAGAPSN